MKGSCNSCEKKVQGIKKPFSWFLWFPLFGFIGYGLYRLIVVRKNKCPICGMRITRKLIIT